MRRRTFVSAVVLGSAVLSLIGLELSAGPLDPPAGPVGSSYKTLGEIEPRIAISATNTPGDADSVFRITQSGSYYLAASVTGSAGKHGIEIVASHVTLDLNGFSVVGVVGSLDGVSATVAGLRDIEVHGGTVRGWGGQGVDLESSLPTRCRVIDLRATDNGAEGMRLGHGSLVLNCTAGGNGSGGIYLRDGCQIRECMVYQNTGVGISANQGCTIEDCTVSFNSGAGISAGVGGTVADCTSYLNGQEGITAGVGCRIVGNTCDDAGAAAIKVGSDCLVERNSCSRSPIGVNVDGDSNRIDGNSCVGNGVSFDVDGTGNIIVRNTAEGGSPNYSIVAGNSVGPRVSVEGNDGWATVPNGDHPWANLGY